MITVNELKDFKDGDIQVATLIFEGTDSIFTLICALREAAQLAESEGFFYIARNYDDLASKMSADVRS